MTTQTYTLLVTITGRQPAYEQALADRICAHLQIGSSDWGPFESAVVDAVAGDQLGTRGAFAGCNGHIKALHQETRGEAA